MKRSAKANSIMHITESTYFSKWVSGLSIAVYLLLLMAVVFAFRNKKRNWKILKLSISEIKKSIGTINP